MFTHKDLKNPKEERIKSRKNNKNTEKKANAMSKAMEAAAEMRNNSLSLGSYTGTARDGGKPQQDADDL